MASFHGIGCSEAFSEVKGSELIFSTRAAMIPMNRNYKGGKKSHLLKEDKKGILCLSRSEEPKPLYSRSVGLR